MTTEERLEKLEKDFANANSNHRWQLLIAGMIVVGLVIAWVVSRNSTPGVLRANSFIVQDGNAKTRASLDMGQYGPELSLYDDNGKKRVNLTVNSTGTEWTMRNEKEHLQLLCRGDSVGTNLILYDDTSATISLHGSLGLTMNDENGKARIRLVTAKDAAVLGLYDGNHRTRASLGSTVGGAGLDLYDEAGNSRAALNVFRSGAGLTLSDEKGKSRAALGACPTETPDGITIKYPESSLFLFGPDGKAIWSAPR